MWITVIQICLLIINAYFYPLSGMKLFYVPILYKHVDYCAFLGDNGKRIEGLKGER